MHSRQNITQLLVTWSNGGREALDQLMPLVYGELRRLARRHLAGERSGHTLNTTALVHEAYIKLVDINRVAWQDRAHFFAMASRAMRRILIDYARARTRLKRGGSQEQVPLEEIPQFSEEQAVELIALDEALCRLAEISDRQCRIVEMRFFSGLTIEETAHVMEISPASVTRDWTAARAWLNHQLGSAPTA